MATSESLIILSGWARDDEESSLAWLGWYRDHLQANYSDLPKIIAINAFSHQVAEDILSGLVGVLAVVRVAPDFDVGSDAAGYQLALGVARSLHLRPDAVLFLHTKGISYDFHAHTLFRDYLSQTTLHRDRARQSLSAGASLVAAGGHLLQGPGGINEARRFSEALGCPPPLAFAAGSSIYWWSGDAFSRALERLQPAFFETPLAEQNFNRFFFESVMPSLAIAVGAEPDFLGGAQAHPELNADCSYHHAPQHNAALVMREWRRWKRDPHGFHQHPVPYVFNGPEGLRIAFQLE